MNNASVDEVKSILYSHTDPDHTMGIRVIEQLRMDWLANSVGERNHDLIEIAALPKIIEELREQKTSKGSMLDYYEYCGLISVSSKKV